VLVRRDYGFRDDNWPMDDRSAARAARMDVRVHASLDAHDRDDAAFWAALPIEQRVLQVYGWSPHRRMRRAL